MNMSKGHQWTCVRILGTLSKELLIGNARFCATSLSALPSIIAERGPGRVGKSGLEREQERHEFIRQIKAAYKSLRASKNQPPKKIWVARELRTGGFNPRTGNDTSAQALNSKLKRLEINYDEVVAEAETELNNNLS